MSGTPLQKDKRFLLTSGVIVLVLVLVAFGRQPNEQVLTFLTVTLGAFMAQSQAGQTIRAKAALEAKAAPSGPAV